MHDGRKSRTLPLLLLGLALAVAPAPLAAQGAVVRAVLFYSPSCPHCHKVMTEDLPPLVDRYGDRLVMVAVDVTTQTGQTLFRATAEHFAIAQDDLGVPMLVAGEEVMMGSVDIPERFPPLIARALSEEGTDWPAVAPLREVLAQRGLLAKTEQEADSVAVAAVDTATPAVDTAMAPGAPSTSPTAPPPPGITRSLTPAETAATGPTVLQRLRRDPAGTGVALLVLVALVLVLAVSLRPGSAAIFRALRIPAWLVPTLCVAGMGVAAYLTFVEVTGQRAVCGPVGDCNAVQQSAYARLFGVLPVGLLGVAGYAAILVTSTLARVGRGALGSRALRLQWGLAFIAAAFSAYLTFLEPFVIGATCMWCIASAAIVGVLLLATTAELRRAGS